MKQLFFLFFFLFTLACQTDNKSVSIPITSDSNDSTASIKSLQDSSAKSRSLTTPTCPLKGNILLPNKIWIPNEQLIVCIAADSSTYDKKFGESHRKLAIYDAHTCKQNFEWTLPINRSPDFPYYLADLNYNNNSHIVAIKGVNSIYCLDLQTNKLLPPVIPTYKTKRVAQDAQSGSIVRLELWEDYLVGYAQDMGSFVFKISKNNPLAPLHPYAEYQVGESTFASLFLIKSNDNKVQAILPRYNWAEEKFSINPVFTKPVIIQPNIVKSALNNQFIILKTIDPKGGIGLDLKSGKKITIPKNIQNKGVQEIRDWMSKYSIEN